MSTSSLHCVASAAIAWMLAAATAAAVEDGTGLLAAYGSGTVIGMPSVTRVDPTIDFDWAYGGPGDGLPADRFWAEWQGLVEAPISGVYQFRTTSDDGVMLWVDDQLLIAHWNDHSPTVDSGSIELRAGERYRVRFRFYENGGGAVARLSWQPPGLQAEVIPQRYLHPIPQRTSVFPAGLGSGLSATYFSRHDFTGDAIDRVDAGVALDSVSVPPIHPTGSGADGLSVIWTGEISAPLAGDISIGIVSAGSALVWIDDRMIIDAWRSHGMSSASTRIAFAAGERHRITIRYCAHGVPPACALWWAADGLAPEIVPSSRLFPKNDVAVALACDAGETTLVDPTWIEGTIAGSGVSVSASIDGVPTTPALRGSRWHLDTSAAGPIGVDLGSDGAARIVVTAVRGETTRTFVRDVRWQTLLLDNPPYGIESLVIRVGDRIRVGIGADAGDQRIDLDGHPLASWQPGSTAVLSWTLPGIHRIRGLIDGTDIGGVNVQVVDVDMREPIACQVDYTRLKDLSTPGDDAGVITFTSATDDLLVGTIARNGASARLTLTPIASGHPLLQARIGRAGPLIAEREIDEFLLDCSADRSLAIIETFPDGSLRGEALLRMAPLVPGLDVRMWIFVSGVTFGDSTTAYTVGTDAFALEPSGSGRHRFELIRASGVSHGFCHDHVVHQAGVQISH
ncbi:MAG: hypothetical protein H0V44_02030 [Planctomycetes bacterium]|nr:hypothetical protein [Planctomycetota bacterium]